jgi:leucyl aminopeptidase (aminopeptidase T)
MNPSEAAANALKFVLGAVPGERLLIICDDEKLEIGEAFAKGALEIGLWTRLLQLKTSPAPRERVPSQVLEILTGQTPDIYINLLRGIGDETPFRIRLIHLETRSKRARLGHCPGVTIGMLTEGALALTAEEHTKMQNFARRLIQTLSDTIKVEISTPAGTNLHLNVEGRPFFTDTQLDWKTMKWMNLPTGEVIVAPVENSMRGTLVCDVAIGGIGPISEPVTLDVQSGRVKEVFSENEEIVKRLEKVFMTDDWSNVVGEFAFGINPKARLTKEFLEAEKIFGTVHVAFGNNLDMPQGKNPSKNHVDLLMSHPSVRISKRDGSVKRVMENGSFCF